MTVGIASRGYYGTIDTLGGPPRVGASGGGATTDWPTIRQRMVTVIKALTPKTLTAHPFHVTRTEMSGFREYAEGFTQNAFRQYEIEDIEDEAPSRQDYQSELRLMTADLIVAYPHTWAWYSTKDANNQHNEASLRAMAHQDRRSLDNAIGVRGGANYTSGQSACWVGSVSFEENDEANVTFMVLPLRVRFDEDVS